ncbi:class I adenylate-forming enzyme family protein [Streptomyces sp. NPDC049813]|uniref:class I adenylate-forming enzyme family protein n=1 Tax=Streptomyces sp. NPDC049813 TaxID=3365597 RepID=UPI0037ABDB72
MSYVQEFLTRATGPWAQREAVVHGGVRLTHGELADRVLGLAAQVASRRGTAAVLARNQVEPLLVHLACHVVGRPVAHVARDAARAVQESFLRECQAVELFADARETGAARALTDQVAGVRPVPLTGIASGVYGGTGGEVRTSLSPAPASSVRTLLCTGGSTGVPKGVAHTHALYEALSGLGDDRSAGSAPRFLVFGDMSHLSWFLALPALLSGGALVLHEGFDAAACLRLVPAERITHLALIPPQLSKLLDHPGAAGTDWSSLRCVTYGAAPAARHRVHQALALFGPVLQQVYGLTECGPVSLLSGEDHARGGPALLASAGRPVPGVEIAVRDAGNQRVPRGETGDVWVKTPAMMAGYLDPARGGGQPVQDGWLRTGDLGRLDADGFLTLCGRAKDLITHHATGTHVYPQVIEAALHQHAAVREAAVFGVPHPHVDGECVHAAVTLASAAVDEQALRAHVHAALGQDHLVPDVIDIVTDLPLTPVGKIDKQALRERHGHRGSRGDGAAGPHEGRGPRAAE